MLSRGVSEAARPAVRPTSCHIETPGRVDLFGKKAGKSPPADELFESGTELRAVEQSQSPVADCKDCSSSRLRASRYGAAGYSPSRRPGRIWMLTLALPTDLLLRFRWN